ncbi:MAG: hypothetical protein ACFE9T_04590 [Promethearchaeota archaeon]
MHQWKFLKKFVNKIKQLLFDEFGGNLVEYALLIGFALFIFFIIVGIITGMLDWVQSLADNFLEMING